MDDIIENSIEVSNFKNYPIYIKNRLKYKITGLINFYNKKKFIDKEKFNWDTFNLNYFINPPLELFFNQDCMKIYTDVSKFIINIKRVELSLNSSWKIFMKQFQLIKQIIKYDYKKMLNVIKMVNIVRGEMISFISYLLSFLMFDIIEISWNSKFIIIIIFRI